MYPANGPMAFVSAVSIVHSTLAIVHSTLAIVRYPVSPFALIPLLYLPSSLPPLCRGREDLLLNLKPNPLLKNHPLPPKGPLLLPKSLLLPTKKDTPTSSISISSILANDIDGAVNTVQHERLTKLLTLHGFPRYLVEWIKEFCTKRRIGFHFKGTSEEPLPFNSGLSQRSPLSPMLYVRYRSPTISQYAPPSKVNSIHVDDDTMLRGVSSPAIAVNSLHTRLHCLIAQATPLGLAYSPAEAEITHLIHTTSQDANRNQNPINGPFRYQTQTTPKDTTKILSITIDHRLTFGELTANNMSKTISMLPTMYRVAFSRGASLETMHHLISMLAIPTLLWASEVRWTGAQHIMDRLKPTYHKLAMAITNLPPWTPTNLLQCEAAMPALDLLHGHTTRKYGICILQGPNSHPNKKTLASALIRPLEKGVGLRCIAYLIGLTIETHSCLEDTSNPKYFLPTLAINIPPRNKSIATKSHLR